MLTGMLFPVIHLATNSGNMPTTHRTGVSVGSLIYGKVENGVLTSRLPDPFILMHFGPQVYKNLGAIEVYVLLVL